MVTFGIARRRLRHLLPAFGVALGVHALQYQQYIIGRREGLAERPQQTERILAVEIGRESKMNKKTNRPGRPPEMLARQRRLRARRERVWDADDRDRRVPRDGVLGKGRRHPDLVEEVEAPLEGVGKPRQLPHPVADVVALLKVRDAVGGGEVLHLVGVHVHEVHRVGILLRASSTLVSRLSEKWSTKLLTTYGMPAASRLRSWLRIASPTPFSDCA